MPNTIEAEAPAVARTPDLPRRASGPVPPVSWLLPAVPSSVGIARRVARQLAGDAFPAVDALVLCVSELVTNSVTHSRSAEPGGTITVTLCFSADDVLIQVRDDGGATAPSISDDVGPESEQGRGLLLVAALAERWGSASCMDGRVTWCRLDARAD